MRFLIETNNDEFIRQLREQVDKEDPIVEIITSYDKFEKVSDQLRKVREALEMFNRSGIGRGVMVRYMQSKGIPRKTVIAALNAQGDFFKELGLE